METIDLTQIRLRFHEGSPNIYGSFVLDYNDSHTAISLEGLEDIDTNLLGRYTIEVLSAIVALAHLEETGHE